MVDINIQQCISRIDAVREVACGTESPYVARSRIGRLAMSAILFVTRESGLQAPDFPRPIPVPQGVPKEISDMAATCNHLLDITRHLSQPSEPLADRWRQGWKELLQCLDDLETCLKNLQGHP